MNHFKQLGISPTIKGFKGDKIKIGRILNKEITVHDFKIEASQYEKGSGKCLHLQIEISGEEHVVFTGSTVLIDTIAQIPREKFPFVTTIVKKENDRFEFS